MAGQSEFRAIFNAFVAICLTKAASAVSVDGMHMQSGHEPIAGARMTLVCRVTHFQSGVVEISKTDSPEKPGITVKISFCSRAKCYHNNFSRYMFTPEVDHVNIEMRNLTRSEDQKWWHCVGSDGSRGYLKLTVYSPPTFVMYSGVPDEARDLSDSSVTLTCETSCVFPMPSFSWFYLEGNNGRVEYQTPGTTGNRTTGCTEWEGRASSTLTLERYTTFAGNADITTRFQCGIDSFRGLPAPLYTLESPDIVFSVRIASVTLTVGSTKAPSKIIVTLDESFEVSCTGGVSRPPPTIVWYMGNEERQRTLFSIESTFTFTPSNSDHEKRIFCEAFNLQTVDKAVSSTKGYLYVKVPVKSLILRDSSIQPVSYIDASEDIPKILTCDPGFSRPDPLIAWYVGGSVQQNSTETSYTYIPSTKDHTKLLYCTTQTSTTTTVVSAKPFLRIQGVHGQNTTQYCCMHQSVNREKVITISEVALIKLPESEHEIVLKYLTCQMLNFKNMIGSPLTPSEFSVAVSSGVVTFYWRKSYNGGHRQVFIIQIQVHNNSWIEYQDIPEDSKTHKISDGRFSTSVSFWAPGTYTARIISENKFGKSMPMLLDFSFKIPEPATTADQSSNVPPAIVGGAVAAVVVVLIVLGIVAVFLWRRHADTRQSQGTQVSSKEGPRDSGIQLRERPRRSSIQLHDNGDSILGESGGNTEVRK